jgi:hypothetical protein
VWDSKAVSQWVHVSLRGEPRGFTGAGGCFTRLQHQGERGRERPRRECAEEGNQGQGRRVQRESTASWLRAGGWHDRHPVGLSLALAVSVLAPSRMHAAFVQVPFLCKHATAAQRLFSIAWRSLTDCSIIATPPACLSSVRRKSGNCDEAMSSHGKRIPALAGQERRLSWVNAPS